MSANLIVRSILGWLSLPLTLIIAIYNLGLWFAEDWDKPPKMNYDFITHIDPWKGAYDRKLQA